MIVLTWICTAAILVGLFVRQMKRSNRSLFAFNWYSLLLFYLFVGYVVPVLVILAGVDFPAASYIHLHPEVAEAPVGAMLLVIFVLGSWLGYALFRGDPLERRGPRNVKQRLLIGFLVILASATLSWIVGFGGFRQAITSVMLIRLRYVASESSATWFMQLTQAAWFVAILALDAFFQTKMTRQRHGAMIPSVVLLGVCGFALLLRGSRGAIGNVLFAMVLYLFARRRVRRAERPAIPLKLRKRVLILIGIAAIVVVIALKPFMVFLEQAGSVTTIDEAAANFEKDLVAGVSTEVEAGIATESSRISLVGRIASEFVHFPLLSKLAFDYDQRYPDDRNYGRDLFIAFGKLLPAFIYEPEGYLLSYRTTYLILDVWDSQVPPGIIAWLLLSGGLTFLIGGAVACGALLAAAERSVLFLLRESWWRESGYIAFGIIFATGFLSGSPSDLVRILGSILFVLFGAIAISGGIAAILPRRRVAPSPALTT